MLVKDWMTKPAITVGPDESMSTAIGLLEKHRIRSLPVVKDDRLAGIITDRHLLRASPSDATALAVHELKYLLAHETVKNLMQVDPVVIPFDGTLDEAAYLLLDHRISSLPVVAGHYELVGVLTLTDILRAFISLTSYSGRGLQFGMLLEDKPGAVADAVNDVRLMGGRIASILSTTDRTPVGFRRLYLRVYGITSQKKAELKQRMLKTGNVYYLIDQEQNQRELISSANAMMATGSFNAKEDTPCRHQ